MMLDEQRIFELYIEAVTDKEYPEMSIDKMGTKRWWLNGVRHRTDGPAVVTADGIKEWWKKGKLHREDGPAVEWANGSKEWWLNGDLHRIDGPAVERVYGANQWWLHGIRYSTAEDWAREVLKLNGKEATADAVNNLVRQVLQPHLRDSL